MTVDELQVLITANTQQLQNEISKTQQSISNLTSNASKSTSNLTSSFIKASIFTKTLGLAIKTVTNNLGGAISRLDTLNNYTNVMSNLGISGEDADASIQRLSDKLTGLPTTLDDAASAVQRFTSANGNIKASTDMFLALNNAILAGGSSTEIQKSALEQLSQAYSKGKPDMMEWRTAMTAMPAQLKQVAQAMGYVSADELGENLRNGKVSMNEFMSTIMKLNKEGANGFQSFEQQAINSTGGVRTSMTNVKTAITRGLTEIMNAIGQSNIAGFFNGVASAINKVIPYITGFVKACVWAVSSITSLFGGKTKKKVDNVNSSLKSLGGSGVSTSTGLDKATGSAKKLNKELGKLAGFDEMNVLTENSSDTGGDSGASSGGAGDLGDLDFSDWDTNLDKTSSKADEIAEKIKSVFISVGDVLKSIWNSDPVQAFVNLVGTQFNFIKDLALQLGTDLWNNMTVTWSNIEGNVSTTLSNISTLFTTMWTDMANGIETWGQPIIEGVSGVFNSIWQDAIDPYLQIVTKAWADFSGMLVEKWNEYGKPLIDNIGEFATKTIELFQSIWDNVLEPIITPFLETLSWLWDEHLSKIVEKVIDFVGKLVNGALEIYNKFIQPLILNLLEKLAPAWAFLSNAVIGVLGSILAVVGDVIGSIIGILGGIIDFVTGVFTGNWSKAWNGIKDIFKNIIDGLVGIFKFPINLIIDGINSFISGLNKVKVPDWVPGVGGKGVNIPKIPKLARGGIIDEPTLAVVGEAGKEAVMPLENNTGWIDLLADKLASKIGGNSGSPIQLVVKIGEDTILDKVIEGMKNKDFETNGEVFDL